MKKIGGLAAMLAMACLCVGVAGAEMYVEGYVGGSQAANMGQAFSVHQLPPTNFFIHLPTSTLPKPPTLPYWVASRWAPGSSKRASRGGAVIPSG